MLTKEALDNSKMDVKEIVNKNLVSEMNLKKTHEIEKKELMNQILNIKTNKEHGLKELGKLTQLSHNLTLQMDERYRAMIDQQKLAGIESSKYHEAVKNNFNSVVGVTQSAMEYLS